MKALRMFLVLLYLGVASMPLAWLALTSIKPRSATIDPHPKYLPVLRSPVATPAGIGDSPRIPNESNEPAPTPTFPATTAAFRDLGVAYAGSSHSFYHYLLNSLIIGGVSTVASVLLGTMCAYGFSRFKVAGAADWLFFILSTRFMPPLAVVAPVLIMYRHFNLQNTHLGLIVLYTAFNLSLAVWLMKGFIDEIPKAYEEAALVDGYSYFAAFWRIILPQATTGMAVTAVFCLISAWNEYGFAMNLNGSNAVTVPVYFAGLQGNISGMPWPQVAAGALLFVTPIIVFTVLVRNHLLRGVTFGTIKQ